MTRCEPGEQVLAACEHLGDRLAAQVGGRQLRHAQVAHGELLPAQRRVEPLRGEPDGVALGHQQSRLVAADGGQLPSHTR